MSCRSAAASARAVRHRACLGGAFDPGIERADHPHAARHCAAHRRLEARSDADHRRRRPMRRSCARSGDEGCLALIGDSTNAVREGRSPSEADVARTLARADRTAPRPRRGHDLRLQCGAHARGRGGRRAPPAAKWSWSGARWTASAQVARETGYLDGMHGFPRRRCLRLSAARQGGGALHRQPGRAARGARAHRRGPASRRHAVEGRPW